MAAESTVHVNVRGRKPVVGEACKEFRRLSGNRDGLRLFHGDRGGTDGRPHQQPKEAEGEGRTEAEERRPAGASSAPMARWS